MVRSYDPAKIPSVYNLEDVPPVRDEKGVTQKVFRGIDQMIGFTVITPESSDSEPHSHPYEQTNMLIQGELDFIVGDDRVSLKQYDIIEIPPDVPHTSRTVSDEPAILLAFWPLREDRLWATDYQEEFDTE
jgi:quercetin dioxygenase-like cupin family protein